MEYKSIKGSWEKQILDSIVEGIVAHKCNVTIDWGKKIVVIYSRVEFNYLKIPAGDDKKYNRKLTSGEEMDVTVSMIITSWEEMDATVSMIITSWEEMDATVSMIITSWEEMDVTVSMIITSWEEMDATVSMIITPWEKMDATVSVIIKTRKTSDKIV
jgi:hypothetical protein